MHELVIHISCVYDHTFNTVYNQLSYTDFSVIPNIILVFRSFFIDVPITRTLFIAYTFSMYHGVCYSVTVLYENNSFPNTNRDFVCKNVSQHNYVGKITTDLYFDFRTRSLPVLCTGSVRRWRWCLSCFYYRYQKLVITTSVTKLVLKYQSAAIAVKINMRNNMDFGRGWCQLFGPVHVTWPQCLHQSFADLILCQIRKKTSSLGHLIKQMTDTETCISHVMSRCLSNEFDKCQRPDYVCVSNKQSPWRYTSQCIKLNKNMEWMIFSREACVLYGRYFIVEAEWRDSKEL